MPSLISERVDRVIRQSPLGRHLSRLRKLAPRLYTNLRGAYSSLFSLDSKHGLERYQARALRRFVDIVPEVVRRIGVLEIGSDLDGKVLRELQLTGCNYVTGINTAFSDADLAQISPALPSGCTLKRADMRDTGLPDSSLGAVFSVSVFEHLLDFERCLAEMHRILVPGGIVYAEFGPIWSSGLGHHVCATADGQQARHWDPRLNPLADFSHLLQSRDEMRTTIANRVPPRLEEGILGWVYDSDAINRLFFEDYLRLVEESPFEMIQMSTDREHVAADMLATLRMRHPSYQVFDVRNVELVLRKPR
ncbi:MAG: class I SAM-dependent methyltransferase [Rhodocyclales bacterium]|nr:class I SAM-dependent methyltransferase [Rhodocyclales bacterium]